MTVPDVSLVVVNYRSAALTLRALAAAQDAAPGLRVEEIVVDNASGGEDVEALRRERPSASVIALGENRGYAAGNNAGIARSHGRHLLLLNPDAFAVGDALAVLVARLDAEPALGVVAPVLLNDDGSLQGNAFRRFPNLGTLFLEYCFPLGALVRRLGLDPYELRVAGLHAPVPMAHAMGAALLVCAEAAGAAGPLDEGYFLYLEETEWQARIAAAGWRAELVPGARFVHLGGGSSPMGHPLASPHYLESIRRHYRPVGAGLLVVWVATLLARLGLRALLALGISSPVVRARYADAGAVGRALAARLGGGGRRSGRSRTAGA